MSDLLGNYQGWVVEQETPYCGQKLNFDATGTLVSGGELGDWTKCQVMRIQHVAVQNGKLTVTAQRVLVPAEWAVDGCVSGRKSEANQGPPVSDDKAASTNELVNGEQVVIETELPPQSDDAAALALMNKLFHVPGELSIGPIYRIGRGVLPPVPVYQPDPSYSAQARSQGHEGTVVVAVIVGRDGKVYRPKVFRSLGTGPDEKAVEVVRTWRFKPATRCGVPVAVQVSIEVRVQM